MKYSQQPGFTVIEVILFVAVSGLLAASLLVGASTAIQRQQYRDAVQSFANFLTTQHARVVSVENARPHDMACPISGASVAPRGQSECVVVGRYIATEGATGDTDGRRYVAHPVYALQSGGGAWQYGMGVADAEYTVHWGARTRLTNQGENTAHIALLMYRDPDTGTLIVRTHSGRYTPATIGNFVAGQDDAGATGDAQFQSREVCVYDRGWFPGERRSVFLSARAGSSDAVTVGLASEGCDDA